LRGRNCYPARPYSLAAVATALAFVAAVLVIGSFGPKAFAQIVFPPSPPTFPPTRPSPSQQAIIHACANTAHSQKVPLADEALDVAVFSLSLMGKNWHEYIKEAKRCLVTNGILVIAETTKSLKARL